MELDNMQPMLDLNRECCSALNESTRYFDCSINSWKVMAAEGFEK